MDRTWRNPNLLVWHGDIWLIDHGAALYFHHDWSRQADPAKPFDAASTSFAAAPPRSSRRMRSWRR